MFDSAILCEAPPQHDEPRRAAPKAKDRIFRREILPRAASAFGADERVMTRKGATRVAELHPGIEVLTQSGFRHVLEISTHPEVKPEIWMPGLSGAAGFRGDARKLMLVDAPIVELLTGHATALMRLEDLAARSGLKGFGGGGRSMFLHFFEPEIIVTDQGCFASRDHDRLPPFLTADESVIVASYLGWGDGDAG